MTIRPEIMISSLDEDRLYKLLESLPAEHAAAADELEEELSRARVVEPRDLPPGRVSMNSTVKFSIDSTRQDFELTLVYPKDVDPGGTTVSILAPVGSALLGLSVGDEIEWPKPGGGTVKVRITEVVYQPERAGDLQR
ncbi:nucleoside diphosphate kinase regulator [Wenzhouxiangella marina]|uniref:Regulator of nucleoside diphosphate kinase n=1 Tax=Wenzhouxiangella marina TaxID=1579979 RepID=A0A0K0XTX9_9GAMM|nr:nucleoside diphosphate kinase regulator [Wenzhouxiangella marina]AKS41138.1 Regulator of nucleoside diphosphate kinase [Wenzhouxiangella marina]MBB6088017.1 regulator of nucleoside diphosphate kinase [Wenzhouxiangella marina]